MRRCEPHGHPLDPGDRIRAQLLDRSGQFESGQTAYRLFEHHAHLDPRVNRRMEPAAVLAALHELARAPAEVIDTAPIP